MAVIVAPRCAALPPSSYNDHDDNLTLVDIANEQLGRNKDEKVPSSQSPQEAKEEKQRVKGWSNTPTQYIPKNARPKNWDVPHFLSSKPLESNHRLPKTRAEQESSDSKQPPSSTATKIRILSMLRQLPTTAAAPPLAAPPPANPPLLPPPPPSPPPPHTNDLRRRNKKRAAFE